MSDEELKRLLVLMAIADDYEEPQHIYKNVSVKGRDCGVSVGPLDVDEALVHLVDSGFARAYQLSPGAPVVELPGVPPRDRVWNCYFWITDEGKQALSSSRERGEWPFDDEGELRPTWRRAGEPRGPGTNPGQAGRGRTNPGTG